MHSVNTLLVAFGATLLASAASFGGVTGTTIFVDDDAPTDPGPNNPNLSSAGEDGSTDFPFDRINEAIDAASNGDTVLIRPGTYFDTTTIDTDGKAITITSSQGPNVTFLDGFATGGASIITINSGEGRDTIIEGLTFRGGSSPNGGAMIISDDAQPIVRGCVFRNNTASNTGPAIAISSDFLIDQQIRPLIEDCLFEDNISTNFSGNDGGAIYALRTSPVIVGSVFRRNESLVGSAIAAELGSLVEIVSCTFEENESIANGAIQFREIGQGSIRLSTFTRNISTSGAGMYFNFSNVLVDRCVVQGNVTSGRGGGMLFDNSDVTVTNSVFIGNFAGDDGAGILIRNSNDARIENCTIVANVAADAIGGVLVSSTSTSSLINTISTGNVDAFGNVPDYGGTGTAAAYGGAFSIVDISGVTPQAVFGDGIFSATPSELFTRVPDPGPDMEWGTIDDDYGDLTLLPTAPAIDAGSSVLYAGPLADLAGSDRAQDDPQTIDTGESFAAPIIDIGAFEVSAGVTPSGCPGDADGNGRTETADLTFVVSNLGCQD